MAVSIDYTAYAIDIFVVFISVGLSALVAWRLDVRKEMKRDRNKKIKAYRELIEAFSSNSAKHNIEVEDVTRILSENHTILDDRFKDLLPSTLEFDAYWCVDGKTVFVGQEGPIPNNLTFYSAKGKRAYVKIDESSEHYNDPRTIFWLENSETKNNWITIADSALEFYNKHSKSKPKRTVQEWKIEQFPPGTSNPII